MKVFIDTEFNGYMGELLSLALVSENRNDPSFYRLYPHSTKIEPWVKKNVVPYFNVVIESEHGIDINDYLIDICRRNDDFNIEIIADWPDDIRLFCEAITVGPGVMMDMPQIFLTFTLERDLCEGPYKPMYPHNALSDADTNLMNYFYNVRKMNGEEE